MLAGGVNETFFIRDKIQFNFDSSDTKEQLHIKVMKQGVMGAEMISDVRIGANDIAQMIERELEHAATNPLMNPNENIQSQLRPRGEY